MASAIAVYLFVCSCCFDAMTYRCVKNVDKDLMNIECTFLKCSNCYKKCCLLGYCARPHDRKKKVARYIFNVVHKTLQSIGYTQQINLLDSKNPNLNKLQEEVIEMSQFLSGVDF